MAAEPRPRVRELGLHPGVLAVGPWNAITDVGGVQVGHRTLRRGESVRTGVTPLRYHSAAEAVEEREHHLSPFGAGLLDVVGLEMTGLDVRAPEPQDG